MPTFREHKAVARARLHSRMQVPGCVYYAPGSNVGTTVNLRVHTKFNMTTGPDGPEYAHMREPSPKIIFDLADGVEPQSGGSIWVSPGEAYRVDTVDLPDGHYMVAYVFQLKPHEADTLEPAP